MARFLCVILALSCMLVFVSQADAQCAGGSCRIQQGFGYSAWMPAEQPAPYYGATYPTRYYTWDPSETYAAYPQPSYRVVQPEPIRTSWRNSYYRTYWRPRLR